MKSAEDSLQRIEDSRAFKVLDRARARGRLGQAILLYGESLDTLETTALALAASLLLRDTRQSVLNHPDCFSLRAANKMRQINAADTRELIRNLQHSSNQGGHKIALIYEAERMHVSSANAFLKTLEEPPADTHLFLLTTRPYELLSTIRSRCQFFRVPALESPVDDAAWQAWLKLYSQWIEGLASLNPRDRERVGSLTLQVFALVYRFEQCLERLGAAAWASQKESMEATNLTEEQQIALETGCLKAFRQKLLKEIETETRSTGYALLQKYPDKLTAIQRAVTSLEQATGLLDVNFKETTALESFLLQSLRYWTA